MSRIPQWKQRELKAKAEREAAEQRARHEAFWAAVEPRHVTNWPTDANGSPIDFEQLPV